MTAEPETNEPSRNQPGLFTRTLKLIRFSHTIFAFPFALGAMLVAARGLPSARTILLILLAMVTARTAAMLFNRLADWEIDKQNPRTADRHKLVPKRMAIALLALSSFAFVGVSLAINTACAILAPIALVIIFGYSLTKRFTSFSHFFLGLALAASPMGAWLAVRGAFAVPPFLLASAVLLWVAGFDIIYATQDFEFDKEAGLRSLVVRLGIQRSLVWAQRLHWVMFVLLALFGWSAGLRIAYQLSLVPIAGALVYEHRTASSLDLGAINRAFFYSNAFVGLVFLLGIAADLLTRR